MGLTLRKVEEDDEKRKNLRSKIFYKYQTKGLHIAEFVQNGILNRYVGILIEELESIKDLKEKIEEVLRNIDKHAIFVKGTDRIGEIIKKSVIIMHANSPSIFIISGEGSAAELIEKNIEKIETILKHYSRERISRGRQETLFFKRMPEEI